MTVGDTDLVVASDDDDADAGLATLVDRVNHLLARGVQHAHNTDESCVCLQSSNDLSVKVNYYIVQYSILEIAESALHFSTPWQTC